MCGFVGYFGYDNIDLEDAREIINNRGPDMNGTKSGDNWKVAFNRLSIHDLSKDGMQPFEYNDIIVYLNGEIFNYIELLEEYKDEFSPKSATDVEIIPFLYNKLIARPSNFGSADYPVNQVRDPNVFVNGKDLYLLYSTSGEMGIGLSKLNKIRD